MSFQSKRLPGEFEPLYVEARRVLLDALTALAGQGAAVIVAGAQAIYLRTQSDHLPIDVSTGAPYTIDSDLAIAPYTTDGDVALDPSLLTDEPTLEAAMRAAGLELKLVDGHVEPGIWVAKVVVEGRSVEIPVDLIVPAGAASVKGRRGARLGPHGRVAARLVPGLGCALVDHSPMTIGALDPVDQRSIVVEVAGSAALLMAKMHKIHDRLELMSSRRVADKDASDVVRLMRATNPEEVGRTLATLLRQEAAEPVTEQGLDHLVELFGRRNGAGIAMATQNLRTVIPEAQIRTLCIDYTTRVLATARGDDL